MIFARLFTKEFLVFPHNISDLEDLRHVVGKKMILPGEPEPQWLRRNAAFARALRTPAPDRPVAPGPIRRLLRLIPRTSASS